MCICVGCCCCVYIFPACISYVCVSMHGMQLCNINTNSNVIMNWGVPWYENACQYYMRKIIFLGHGSFTLSCRNMKSYSLPVQVEVKFEYNHAYLSIHV